MTMTEAQTNDAPLFQAYTGAQRQDALKNDEPAVEKPDDTESTGEAVNWEQRYANLRSHSAKEKQELSDKLKAANKKAEATPEWTPPANAEELETFKRDHPEVANIFETIAHDRSQDALKEAKELRNEVLDLREDNLRKDAMNVIVKAYPDFETILQSDKFAAWYDTQPHEIQKWVTDNATDGTLGVRVIDLFVADTGYKSGKKSNAKKLKSDAATLVNSKNSTSPSDEAGEEKIWTRKEIQNISQVDWDNNTNGVEDAVMKAMSEGRIRD